ncbi:MAG: Glu/Leu/Phe/Val dehydrogenase dimerization domain-containing protein [Nanoarchaeota archaeon]
MIKSNDKNIAKKIFETMEKENCRQITFHYDPKTKLKLIWVIDSIPEKRDKNRKLTQEVSASGGTRFAHKNADVALQDALKLARAMTRKANVLGVKEGGCKAVILANQKKNKQLLHSVGDFIQIHKGLFKTAIDLGFVMEDGKQIASRADYVDSLSHLEKGLGSTGENTAEGMIYGFEVICEEILNKPLQECSIAIQGLGAVGFPLAEKLLARGCQVIGTDVIKLNCEKAKQIGVKIVSPNKILFQKVDILSPCALGAAINKKTIPKLKCKIIAGGANNPLENEFEDERSLLKKKIIYVPDFILNCGGFLQALVERKGGTIEEARKKSTIIRDRLKEVINHSKKNKLTLLESAIKIFDGYFKARPLNKKL